MGIALIGGTLLYPAICLQLIPGTVFLLMAFITKQAVGYGDGVVLLLVGILLEFHLCIAMIFIGLILCSIASITILILKRGNRQTRLPFMPFLLTAWGVILIAK